MDFLTLAFDILQWIGVFPSREWSKWKSWFYSVYQIMIFTIIFLTTILMTIQMFVSTDLTILARTIDMWTLFLSGLYKWFYMSLFHEDFARLKTKLFEIQALGSVAFGRRSADMFTTNYLKKMQRVTFVHMMSGTVVIGLTIVSPLLMSPKGDRSYVEYYNDPKSYPFSCWMPFTVNKSWLFWIIFNSHIISSVIIGTTYLGIDSFMFGAIYTIGGQIELLNSSINRIGNYLEKSECNERVSLWGTLKKKQIRFYSILRNNVKHHIFILDYIKRIHKLFTSLIIVDYLHGITSLSFALFQITTSKNLGETISIVSFVVVSVWHQFLNNFFGEFIIQKQLSVSVALYHTPWWRAEKSVRQLLTLMMLRSIKPTFITGFYMYKLSYESFISFMKALYTYYMVLKRVNAEDKKV
ncbi:uncharacterized protein LOC112680402 [Sipha flava]|uniref:Odorant receptor n=1 Tax=Sipha flava TaxID=143950 RepID=A0A8B8F6B0_9HEMI|nr:uncharacterized protein LOC112680402 [Sipha flava]